MCVIDSDLTIDDVLADPVILAVLRADRVPLRVFETLLFSAASRLTGSTDAQGEHSSSLGDRSTSVGTTETLGLAPVTGPTSPAATLR